jgi:hypothetical protein
LNYREKFLRALGKELEFLSGDQQLWSDRCAKNYLFVFVLFLFWSGKSFIDGGSSGEGKLF